MTGGYFGFPFPFGGGGHHGFHGFHGHPSLGGRSSFDCFPNDRFDHFLNAEGPRHGPHGHGLHGFGSHGFKGPHGPHGFYGPHGPHGVHRHHGPHFPHGPHGPHGFPDFPGFNEHHEHHGHHGHHEHHEPHGCHGRHDHSEFDCRRSPFVEGPGPAIEPHFGHPFARRFPDPFLGKHFGDHHHHHKHHHEMMFGRRCHSFGPHAFGKHIHHPMFRRRCHSLGHMGPMMRHPILPPAEFEGRRCRSLSPNQKFLMNPFLMRTQLSLPLPPHGRRCHSLDSEFERRLMHRHHGHHHGHLHDCLRRRRCHSLGPMNYPDGYHIKCNPLTPFGGRRCHSLDSSGISDIEFRGRSLRRSCDSFDLHRHGHHGIHRHHGSFGPFGPHSMYRYALLRMHRGHPFGPFGPFGQFRMHRHHGPFGPFGPFGPHSMHKYALLRMHKHHGIHKHHEPFEPFGPFRMHKHHGIHRPYGMHRHHGPFGPFGPFRMHKHHHFGIHGHHGHHGPFEPFGPFGPHRHCHKERCKSKKDSNIELKVSEDENNYYIYGNLNGIMKDDVKIKCSKDNILTISNEGKDKAKKSIEGKENHMKMKNKKHCKKGRKCGRFRKMVNIPEDANPENIKAKYFDDGMLKITIQKTETPIEAN